MSYGTTQCQLPPDAGQRALPQPQPDRPILNLPTPERQKTELTFVLVIHCVQKKNTHSRFLSYLHGKWSDFHKVFRECLGGN